MSLTVEGITQAFSNNETVEIANATDYNAFITYINSNPTYSSMRNVSITADIDFNNIDMTMYASIEATNLTIDGRGHTLKNIVKQGISNEIIFFGGAFSTNSIIKNITFSNCYFQVTGAMFLFRYGNLQNVRVEKSRFISGRDMYITYSAASVSYLSVSATFFANETYYGVRCSSIDHSACINDIHCLGNSSMEAHSIYCIGTASYVYTRDKFTGYASIYGVYNAAGLLCSTSYSAISSNDATAKHPFGGRRNFSACYYDNTLIPDAAEWTDMGVSTQVLQSISEMSARGWLVRAVN